MKARAFAYRRVESLQEALAAFAACEGEARYLTGGQSLLPALKLRLDAPDLLIDIGRIAALRGIADGPGGLRLGALTRHAEILRDPLVAARAPLLAEAAAHVAHPAIRNQGTLGGNLALADPASEFPACMLALGARMEIAGAGGARMVAAEDFFRDLYDTALAPGEILAAVWVPPPAPGQRHRFDELARRRGDYALAGLAASADLREAGRVAAIRLAFCAVGPTPMRAPRAEAALTGRPLDREAIRAAQAALGDDLAPADDASLSGAVRLHLARVLLGRVLASLAGEAP
ncbi:molybdopterin dehydrogenase FAD-binding [Methylobacterium sp. 4-46]|uniref:FAD binding domain-containing protein n=1 Tax=unclassified Methylobacterium TaxID=2615210 RepID=UPI000152D692|nr:MULTISPECIES: xanthine dehydrogenase family protein subunit M [Methylobacterium]ACA15114.1 molybdopterin dehydrogenase FAD-binding [Methylobacterium sp. 4-46]WFT80847.1 xanthine dehydrogenase family protein subunit M [Methylobacterium nodulans]